MKENDLLKTRIKYEQCNYLKKEVKSN